MSSTRLSTLDLVRKQREERFKKQRQQLEKRQREEQEKQNEINETMKHIFTQLPYLDTAIQNLLTLKKNKQTLLKQFKQTVGKRKLQQETKTKHPNDDTPTANPKTLVKLSKTPTPTILKSITPSKTKTKTTTKTRTKTDFTNHPDYE